MSSSSELLVASTSQETSRLPLDSDMEMVVEQHLHLSSFYIFPAGLFSMKTFVDEDKRNCPIYELSFSDYPVDDVEYGFKAPPGLSEEDNKYNELLEKHVEKRCNCMINRLGLLQKYKNQLMDKLDELQKTNPESGTLNFDLIQILNGPIRKRLEEVENKMANIINSYIWQAFEDGDGSESIKMNDQVLRIETKLSYQNITQISSFLRAIGGFMGKRNPLGDIMNEQGQSELPNMSEHTSPLSAYCQEFDPFRKHLQANYSTLPRCRNILEARCKLVDNMNSSSISQATLKDDIYIVCKHDGLISVSMGEHVGDEKHAANFRVNGLRSASINSSTGSVIVSTKQGFTSLKIIAENNDVKNFEKEFTLPFTGNFEKHICEKGKLYCLDSKDDKLYTINLEDANQFTQTELPMCDSYNSTLLSYNTFNDKLYTSSHAVLYEIDIASGRSYYLVGTGNQFSDLAFERNLILASSRDKLLHLYDTRVQFTPVIRFSGHGGNFLHACEIANVDGNPFVFSGGDDQCVRCWDLRMQLPLYELSTGNNTVIGLDWHNASSSLLTSTRYCPSWGRMGEDEEIDDWQNMAHHKPTHFLKRYNLEQDTILKYSFRDQVEENTKFVKTQKSQKPKSGVTKKKR